MADCPFCEIVAGTRDAHRVHEGEHTVAFLDDDPAARGHLLVVPRDHREHLFDGDDALVAAVFRTVHRVSLALDRALDPDGVSVFYTTSDLVGSVTHAHVHVVPRYADDDIRLALARQELDEADARELAARLRGDR